MCGQALRSSTETSGGSQRDRKIHAGNNFDRETANTPDGGQRRGAASRRNDRGTGGQAGATKRLREAGPHGRDTPHPGEAGHHSQAAQRGGPYHCNAGRSGPPYREDGSRRHNSTMAPAREAGGSRDGSAVATAQEDISGTPPVTGDLVPTTSSQSAPVVVRTTTASQTNPEDACHVALCPAALLSPPLRMYRSCLEGKGWAGLGYDADTWTG